MKKKEKNFLGEYSRFLDSPSGHLSYSALSVYRNFAGELSKKERHFLADHLGACTVCSARLKEIEEVETGQMSARKPLFLWTSAPAFQYSMAAVLVVALAIVVAFLLQNRVPMESPSRLPAGSQGLAARTPDPERYVPNDVLENFISRQVRSAAKAEFISPKNGDTLITPFRFAWSSMKGAHKFVLVIVDNKNTEVWKEKTPEGKLIVSEGLEPGLYYAKLEVDGALAQVRKFIAADAVKK